MLYHDTTNQSFGYLCLCLYLFLYVYLYTCGSYKGLCCCLCGLL